MKQKHAKQKNTRFLLFKQAFKQALRNKIQLVGLALLVLLSSTIFSLMQTSIARINDEYSSLVGPTASNIHDFIVDPYESTVVNQKLIPQPPAPPKDHPTAEIESWQLVLQKEMLNDSNQFIYDRIESRNFQLDNNGNPKVLKLVTDNNINTNSINNTKCGRIDRLVITEGYNIGANPNEKVDVLKQIVINREFAKKNKLVIGDYIRVQEDRFGNSLKVNSATIPDPSAPQYSIYTWLKIVGFGVSADFMTPIINETTPLPNKTKEGIVYVNPNLLGLYQDNSSTANSCWWFYDKAHDLAYAPSKIDREVNYVGQFIGSSNLSKAARVSALSKKLKTIYTNNRNSDAALVYQLGDSNYRFNSRTSTLPTTLRSATILLICLLIVVLAVTGLTVILVTAKNVDNSKPQFGVLKSLGYSNRKILITALAYPMIASFLGTALVFFPASGLQILVTSAFSNYFNLNFGTFILNPLGFVYCLILTFGFLSIIAWIISAIAVIKNPMELIRNNSVIQQSKIGKLIEHFGNKRSFLTRFRLALFSSSIGKMTAVAMTMFLGTSLMTTAIIGPKIMSDNEKLTYTGMNYKTLTEYVPPVYNSPFSFLKTYDPNYDVKHPNQLWNYVNSADKPGQGKDYFYPDRGVKGEKYIDNLIENSISAEAYAPIAYDVKYTDINNPLSYLQYYGFTFLGNKMLTKNFLQNLDKSDGDPTFISLIVQFGWPAAKPVYDIANSQDKNLLYSNNSYSALRNFYLAYRSTIMMSINPKFIGQKPTTINKESFKNFAQVSEAWKSDTSEFEKTLKNFNYDETDHKYPLHDQKDATILATPTPPKNLKTRNDYIREMLVWFMTLYYNRVGQAVAQGAYSQSPYFIRQNMANALSDPNKAFNISFNTVPYDQTTDELGTYFDGIIKKPDQKDYEMKVYGIQNQKALGKPSQMQLYDRSGNSLNAELENSTNPGTTNIVINQTVAKQLHLSAGQQFRMSANGTVMETNQDPEQKNKFTPIDINKINFDSVQSSTGKDPLKVNNANLNNQNIKFNQIPSTSSGAFVNIGINPDSMAQEIQQGHTIINHDKTETTFKVVGVYNGYGAASAYISKTKADQILHYDTSKNALYQDFRQEWMGKGTIVTNKLTVNFEPLTNATNYQAFLNLKDKNGQYLQTMFNNEFPIFNFKFSKADNIPDIDSTYAVTQQYGDSTPFGLNGGNDGTNIYNANGLGAAQNILPLRTHQQVLQQLTKLVDTILLFFIIFSLSISFFIILLTSDLVIYENRKVIATMKTLGYSDIKITNIVIGMYLPIIAAMFAIGLPVGWYVIVYIINFLAAHSSWVLPLFFAWWIPIAVGLIVFSIYIATFLIEWNSMKRIRPLDILQTN